jgi:hypothetical protein
MTERRSALFVAAFFRGWRWKKKASLTAKLVPEIRSRNFVSRLRAIKEAWRASCSQLACPGGIAADYCWSAERVDW